MMADCLVFMLCATLGMAYRQDVANPLYVMESLNAYHPTSLSSVLQSVESDHKTSGSERRCQMSTCRFCCMAPQVLLQHAVAIWTQAAFRTERGLLPSGVDL
ncbi:MAG: hypothetical protein B7Y12_15210 [Rhizobiales bacterium 24-66-13]|nr:MAG: hypothetical protein B7Y12_15210 [Rhizobiales bacterium 24-66-13]OZB04533.1 MAG: hypothetical protein B7X67_13950 [Rhizobiales bacterium 39-66-18]